MREVAINLAAKGFRVFPLIVGTKRPAWSNWQERATSDQFAILEEWPDEPGTGVAVSTAGLVVVDVDAGRAGFETLPQLGELPPTFTVRSARGGLHMYFRPPVPLAGGVDKFGPGIDAKAEGGYVVAPGSSFEGRLYSVERDAPVAPLPPHLAAMLAAATEKPAEALRVLGEVDTPEAVERARAALLEAAPAVEGQGGDQTTYNLACRVLDFGLSPETAADLMATLWDDRCEPPWGYEALLEKCQNAARYRQDPIGRDNPANLFPELPAELIGAIEIERNRKPAAPAGGFAARVWAYDETAATAATIPPRPWIVQNRIMRGIVTVLAAQGSVGKSLWSMQLGYAVATGNGAPIGLDIRETCNVLIVNNEDSLDEMRMRLEAMCKHFELDRSAAHGRLFLYSGADNKFRVVERKGRELPTDGPLLGDMREFIAANRIGLVVADPLVSMHVGLTENDNGDMQSLMDRFTAMATGLRIGVLLVHHTNKPPAASSEGRAGNVDTIRGASAIKDAARVAVTMFNASAKDGEAYGIPPEKRHRYVRMDDAKANLHLASPEADWFVRRSVKVGAGEGEWLGVLEPISLKSKEAEEIDVMLISVAAELAKRSTTVNAAVKLILQIPMFSTLKESTLRTRVAHRLSSGEVVAGGWRFLFDARGGTGGTVSAIQLPT